MKTEKSEDFKYELIGYFILIILILLVIIIFKFFMFGLPSATLEKSKRLVQYYDQEYRNFEVKEDVYESQKKEPYYKGIKAHELDEQWQEYFKNSEIEFKNIKIILDEIDQLIDINSRRDKENIDAMIRSSNSALKQTIEVYQYPLNRLAEARKTSNSFENIVASIEVAYNKAQQKLILVKNYPLQTQDSSRSKLAAIFMERVEKAKEIVDDVLRKKYQGEMPDVLALNDSHKIIENIVKKLDYLTTDEEKSAELLLSKAKVLIDMQVKYFFVPERYSWNNYSDYNTQMRYIYDPIEIGYEQYQTLLTKENTKLSTALSPHRYTGHPVYELHGQNIFDMAEKWPSNSTNAEYWLKELYPKYYHKYMVFIDGFRTELEWMEVDEKQFYRHIPHFGMQIYSKPYGMFSDEAIVNAAPVAMAFVDNKMYGKWLEGPEGKYWKFNPKYEQTFALYMIQDYYSEDEYNEWKKSQIKRVDFYGLTHRYGTYSTETYKHPTYLNSNFVRLYIDLLDIYVDSLRYRGVINEESGSGGASSGSTTRSAKSSGRSLRGGGPGGYGK